MSHASSIAAVELELTRTRCKTSRGNALIGWSDETLLIGGIASLPARRARALFRWWHSHLGGLVEEESDN